jgi:hypothetical protein
MMEVGFITLVIEMRAIQKDIDQQFIRGLSKERIRELRQAEKRVDEAITRFLAPGSFYSAMMEG